MKTVCHKKKILMVLKKIFKRLSVRLLYPNAILSDVEIPSELITDDSGAVCQCRCRERQGDCWSEAAASRHGGSDWELQNQRSGTWNHEAKTTQYNTGA